MSYAKGICRPKASDAHNCRVWHSKHGDTLEPWDDLFVGKSQYEWNTVSSHAAHNHSNVHTFRPFRAWNGQVSTKHERTFSLISWDLCLKLETIMKTCRAWIRRWQLTTWWFTKKLVRSIHGFLSIWYEIKGTYPSIIEFRKLLLRFFFYLVKLCCAESVAPPATLDKTSQIRDQYHARSVLQSALIPPPSWMGLVFSSNRSVLSVQKQGVERESALHVWDTICGKHDSHTIAILVHLSFLSSSRSTKEDEKRTHYLSGKIFVVIQRPRRPPHTRAVSEVRRKIP